MAENTFEVNEKACVRCGLCAADCVCNIIQLADAPFIATENLDKCIRCGHCQAICPTDAITLNGIDPKSLAQAEKPVVKSVIENIVKNRRSTRHFSSGPVDAKLLADIINTASWAPTAKNTRDIGFVIFNGRQKLEKLMLASADIMEKYKILPEVSSLVREGRDILFRDAPCLLVAHAKDRHFAAQDCATTLAIIELALPSFGMASCWGGYFTAVCGLELPSGLELPQGHHVYGALMMGKPTVTYRRVPARPEIPVDWV